MAHGTKLFLDTITGLNSTSFELPSALPGWTRKHLVAHVAANAEALGNLVHWAGTGEPTPMYSSPDARAREIEAGSTLPAHQLVGWATKSAKDLGGAMSRLTSEQWHTPVMTTQGRTVPATEIPWLRAREVFVHFVDLDTGRSFADLPGDFLTALQEDIIIKRGDVPGLAGRLADVTAYLAGRPYTDVTLTDGGPAPSLSPWL
jgi:maleylpyruvate isomerase